MLCDYFCKKHQLGVIKIVSLLMLSCFSMLVVADACRNDEGETSQSSIPLIVDDDGSQDGMVALLYLLQNPKFDVKAITISQGLAHPKIFGENMMRMLTRLKITGIPVGVGSEVPLTGNNAFPEAWRKGSDAFWAPFVKLPKQALETVDKRDAAALIIDTVRQSFKPVTILATGPLTNIAEAFARQPSIVNNITALHIMGGAVHVPGNLEEAHNLKFTKNNQVAEWNIWVDPIAAKKVFSSGLTIYLMPLDATNQVKFSWADQKAWKAKGTKYSSLASEFLNFGLTVISNVPNPLWDLVAAINLAEPKFCHEELLHLDIVTDVVPEPKTIGQTRVVPAINVCRSPRFEGIEIKPSNLF